MKIYTRRQLMMEEARVKPYISDGLVFHLDGADATDTTWVDRVNNVTFNMHNVTCDGKRVYFNGTSSYGQSSTVVNYSYNSSTIEVVIYKTRRVGFLFEPINSTAIRYIQGSSHVSFTWGAAGKRSGVADQGVGKIITHSINMDRDICNSKLIPFVSNDTWAPRGSGTLLGRRGDGSNPFQGNVYQIRIYNRKLSEAEILFNQEQDRKRYGITF